MELRSHKQALKLSYFTLGYTLFEFTGAIVLGIFAGSTALIAFGLDSLVESISGSVMIWRFRTHSDNHAEEEKTETQAVKLVSLTFFVLGIYVLGESLKSLYLHETALPSPVGIAFTILALIIMFVLYRKKVRLAKSINSISLMADAKQSLACSLLAAATLVGLILNYFGLWWADPLAAFFIGVLLIREGYHTYREKELH